MVVFLFVGPPADGRALAVVGGAWRPGRPLARGGTRGLATRHGTLRTSVGRRIEDFPVYDARLRPRGDPVFARDPAHRTLGGARTRSGFGGELSGGWLPGHGPAPLSCQRPRAGHRSQAGLAC